MATTPNGDYSSNGIEHGASHLEARQARSAGLGQPERFNPPEHGQARANMDALVMKAQSTRRNSDATPATHEVGLIEHACQQFGKAQAQSALLLQQLERKLDTVLLPRPESPACGTYPIFEHDVEAEFYLEAQLRGHYALNEELESLLHRLRTP